MFLLLTSDGQACTSQSSLLISPLGLDLQLQVIAGQELVAITTLTLKPDQNPARKKSDNADVSTDLGKFP